MDKRIIYTNDDGTLAIVIPADEFGLTIEQIATKDVPAGKEYKIVDVSEIPFDRTYRNAWKQDDAGKIVEDSIKVDAIDSKIALKEADVLIAQKQKELAVASLKAEGVLDSEGFVK